MSEFAPFGLAVHNQYTQLAKGELYTVALSGQDVWDAYIAAFPPGTNEIFRTRAEHDCSCCKNFIRNIGNVVAIIDDKVVSVWGVDSDKLDYPYNLVAEQLDRLVRERSIASVFRSKEPQYGAAYTMEPNEIGPPIKWNHFHGKVVMPHLTSNPEAARGHAVENMVMLTRAMNELKPDALNDIHNLISDKTLYRGEEHLGAVTAFRYAQKKWAAAPNQDLWLWQNAPNMGVSRFRNTVIGTLAVDLSNGVDLEQAVKSFEEKVAPQNYKRPSALITKSMILDAETTVAKLGLLHALQRRFARLSDVSVQDVLWVDGSKRDVMRSTSPFAQLMTKAAPSKKSKVVGDKIGIDEFMQDVLPGVSTMEVMVKNTHQHNFVSLTAPVEASETRLFKWDNPFAWSYAGNVTDSIKERVKRAGGNTGAALRVSVAWYNKDDLDLHSTGPDGHVYFGNKLGILDVDMNAGFGTSREPVENQSWKAPRDGTYKIVVNQYNQRETIDVGFTLEMECNNGFVQQWTYDKPVKGQVQVLEFTVKKGMVEEIKALKDLVGGGMSRERWGVATETFVKVNTLLYSPNYWGEQLIGNRHYIFALDGCVNDEPTRGIYNEYLNDVLTPHRKVFEVLGSKTLCPPSDDQISGVGFSSTRGDTVTIRADKRVYEVSF